MTDPASARAAEKRRDWDAALALWDQCVREAPDDRRVTDWQLARVQVLVELRRYAEAEEVCRRLAADRPELAEAFVGVARIAMRRRDWSAAAERWQACLDKFPEHAGALRWRARLGTALTELDRYAAAEEIFHALTRLSPDAPDGFAGLARTATRRKVWAVAVERWDACLARFPTDAEATAWRISRAWCLEALGRRELAGEAWEVLEREVPANPFVVFGRAGSLVERFGPTKDLEDRVAAELQKFPQEIAGHQLYARIAIYRGDLRTALARHLRCVELNPESVSAHQFAMLSARRCGDLAAAERLLAAAPPKLANTIDYACRVLLTYHFLRADLVAGLKVIERIDEATLDRPSAEAVGKFLEFLHQYEQQLGFADRMLKRFSDDPIFIRSYLAGLYQARGRPAFEEAKPRLLAPLSAAGVVRVLRALPGEWLSVDEAKAVIDDRLPSGWASELLLPELAPLLYRREKEVVAHLAERLKSRGPEAGLFASMLLAKLRDLERIGSANLDGSKWADFAAASRVLARDIETRFAEVDRTGAWPRPLVEAMAALHRATRRSREAWVNSADCYYDAASVAAWLAARIRRGEPTSLIRLNDGEGTLLPYPRYCRAFQRIDRRFMQIIWWGEERIAGATARQVTRDFTAAILRADAIGIPPPKLLITDLRKLENRAMERGLVSVLAFVDEMPPEILRGKILTSSHVHADLAQWGLYRQVLAAVSSVSVISCHDLARPLAERFGVAVRCWLRIPPEYKFAGMFGAAAAGDGEPFFPMVFDRIMASLAPLPGEVFLVAAGFLGKLLCDRIREKGGIAIDIGSVADLLMGHTTRRQVPGGVEFDIACSLIAGQPFADDFDPRAISRVDPCRSDHIRRHNLTGQFDHLSAAEVSAQSGHDYALRVIGHPRCGSFYVSEVLCRLGLNIGHELPGDDGLCSWIHTVDDCNPPFNMPAVPAAAFRVTLAYVRDPNAAVPSIMLENLFDESFSFRRFHIARLLGVDVAAWRDPLARAVASYALWMEIVARQRPLLTLRVEHLLDELAEHDAALRAAGIDLRWAGHAAATTVPETRRFVPRFHRRLRWAGRAAAAAVRTNLNASSEKVPITKPVVPPARYRELPAELSDRLAALCCRYGYPIPGAKA